MPIPEGLLEGIKNLDPLPITAQRLTQAVSDESVSVNEMAEIIEFDEAVASNILRVANSALYGGLFPVQRIRDAVVRLGTNILLNIALDQHLKHLRVDSPLYDLSENDLWLHGAVASLAINEIIREAGGEAVPQSATIAALVHDIGKLIIVRYMKQDIRAIRDRCVAGGVSFAQAERDLLGCDHAEVGGAIARKWKFPEEIATAIEQHHKVPVPSPSPTSDAVMLSNLITKTLGVGLGAEGMNFEFDLSISDRLGIFTDVFSRVCANTAARMADLKEAYGIAA